MEKLKNTLQQILKISEYAPELNMCNYDEDQVRELNNAMIEIHHIVKSALANAKQSDSLPSHGEVNKWIDEIIIEAENFKNLYNHPYDNNALKNSLIELKCRLLDSRNR